MICTGEREISQVSWRLNGRVGLTVQKLFVLSPSGITQSLVLLSEVESAVPSLVSVSSNIQRELQMAQKNLSDAVAQCKKDSGGGACDSLPEGNDLQTEANFTKVL